MLALRQRKVTGRHAHQFTDRMFGEVALAGDFIQLCLGFGQLILRASQVQFGGDLAFITAARQLQGLAVILQRTVENLSSASKW